MEVLFEDCSDLDSSGADFSNNLPTLSTIAGIQFSFPTLSVAACTQFPFSTLSVVA
ncbi:MAG: hypothetical protein V9E86_11915 [Nitrosomonas sp.]